MVLDGTASFKAAHDKPRMKDPAVLAMRAKVQVIPDAEMEKMEPARQATVEITLNDGTVLSEHVSDVRGTVDNPMTREEVVQKVPRPGRARPRKRQLQHVGREDHEYRKDQGHARTAQRAAEGLKVPRLAGEWVNVCVILSGAKNPSWVLART